ncbi:MAG: protein-tyrosine-phosphatase, partial [Chloroflexi bacterium]|nr:protein-tyrosine-phosphatase [Chloroflexota bacterium]
TIDALKNGENTVIHCHAGIGRTGMFAAMLAHELLALDSQEAIAWVRTYVPYAIDTDNQKSAVEDYINKK